GIGEIHAESWGEVQRIAKLADALGCLAQVGLRINPSLASAVGSLQMGGKPSQFGIDEEQIDEVIDQTLALSSIKLVGLHLNTGTQLLDAQLVLAYYQHAVSLCQRVSQRIGRCLETLDLGGGLGIPYFQGQSELNLDQLKVGLEALPTGESLGARKLLLEPGRFLIGSAGVYVARVIDIKVSRGQTFVVLDGGMHHHLAASGNFGQLLRRPFPIAVLNRLNESAGDSVSVVGPLCTPLDTLARHVALPTIELGDLVGIMQSGAYSRTSSPMQFLGHPAPPEILIDGGVARLIRRRGCWEDSLVDVVNGDEGQCPSQAR
ncbi:MAG: hypothetical protein KDA92_17930, partial [Planctomycetales bacterium]|nr:hypothetical protein [Planctomycetales bacterium]